MDTLVVRQGSKVLGRYPLGREKEIVIGRAGDIPLRSPTVSARHAMIRSFGRDHMVGDLGSRNGTSLNGQRLSAGMVYRLKHGDTIEIEDFVIRCVIAATNEGAAFTEFAPEADEAAAPGVPERSLAIGKTLIREAIQPPWEEVKEQT